MKFYEVSVEADNEQGNWQGIGYWFVKPEAESFGLVMKSIQLAVACGLCDHGLWHDTGLCILVSVIDVPVEDCAKFQRSAYLNDQADRRSTLKWCLVSARFGLNGEVTNGQG